MESTIKIGNATITVNYVDHSRTNREEGGDWIMGLADVEWIGTVGGRDIRRAVKVKVGCWNDTDDDHAEWSASHEGARAILACIGSGGSDDFARIAFRNECEQLGLAICHMLREVAVPA